MKEIYLGESRLKPAAQNIDGKFVEIDGEKFYQIRNYNRMPDFFMTIVSDSDLWMYISSNGALTAGRKNRNNALFPYYTEDKIHDYREKTGSYTVILVEKSNKTFLWEPFSTEAEKVYRIERNIYKSIYGNKVVFEAKNLDLGVCFRYGWYNSDRFGWVKKASVQNVGNSEMKVNMLDGIRNILPYGVDYAFQNEYSNLLDAYKKNELLEESRLGLFMLSSIPVDRAEPSEALKATTVWPVVPEKEAKYLISDRQLDNFRQGLPVETETDVRAARGTYYVNLSFVLNKDEEKEWYIVADVNKDAADVANLDRFIRTAADLVDQLTADIEKGTQKLIKIVGSADGLQLGNEELGFARHFSNTLFNVMRGGIFSNGYTFETADFILYLKQNNTPVAGQFAGELAAFPKEINRKELLNWAATKNSPELERICLEYLPLTFSRRHGDPSRPWNQFSIETKNEDGTDKLNYQGNWRDIFQNWEALCLSFPEYIESAIARFVNASTPDGYNPYRITREGIDWECPDPDDPWAYIGYWGDHQIIYLLKFLEQSAGYHPGKLEELLKRQIFVYANVPYRIKPFEQLVANPKDTIRFDVELNRQIREKTAALSADAKLVFGADGNIYRVNLMEKILATLLSKLSNFIPEAGIWLNTQRPEWNDANNALVGNGVSMVTVYYIRRFLEFWRWKLGTLNSADAFEVSVEMKEFFNRLHQVFSENAGLCETGFSDTDRYRITALLGKAGTDFRESVYNSGFSGEKSVVQAGELKSFMETALKYIDQSIRKNKRDDGLYHAYNLVSFKNESISIRTLYEMLEGQVAVLSSGLLNAAESLEILDALKASKLFREDQYSYILYPDRQLPRFEEKNNIPAHRLGQSKLLQALASDFSQTVVRRDMNGVCHFNGAFRNAEVLAAAIGQLDTQKYGELVKAEKQLLLDIYEEMFDHQSFTGRSGTFFGYEGLGSIYWHMVSKLLLATQESFFRAVEENAGEEILGRLKQHYYEIKAGIGLYKSPALYGAFPTDAYSHTPAHAGAKQPGLTGQVKEDVISRFGELGVRIENGAIVFNTALFNPNELLQDEAEFRFINAAGEPDALALKTGELAFTVCQVPVVFSPGSNAGIFVTFSNGETKSFAGHALDPETGALIFSRSGAVKKVVVTGTVKLQS